MQQFEAHHTKETCRYTAPLVRLVSQKVCGDIVVETSSMSLAEDWPWWSVPEDTDVRDEIQADPRWEMWKETLK